MASKKRLNEGTAIPEGYYIHNSGTTQPARVRPNDALREQQTPSEEPFVQRDFEMRTAEDRLSQLQLVERKEMQAPRTDSQCVSPRAAPASTVPCETSVPWLIAEGLEGKEKDEEDMDTTEPDVEGYDGELAFLVEKTLSMTSHVEPSFMPYIL